MANKSCDNCINKEKIKNIIKEMFKNEEIEINIGIEENAFYEYIKLNLSVSIDGNVIFEDSDHETITFFKDN